MINYRKTTLDNGLTVLTHEAWDTPMATVNTLYRVGSRNEEPHLTGFAHLFEHLMFGGTARVPDFDRVVSGLGGECNAFTNCDYTNYYITLPASGLATALRIEADRMQGLDLSERTLRVQQQVVTEEYNQRYCNQPYGDVWLVLRPLCYRVHPYRWATIGADIRHVSEARLEDVVEFHSRWYRPDNAIVATAAPMHHDEQLRLVTEAYGTVKCPTAPLPTASLPAEPEQTAPRHQRVEREVPESMVYLAWPMGERSEARFRACDLLSDVLGSGASSRLQRRLVHGSGLLSEADACISGDSGPGLMVVSGKLAAGVSADEAVEALRAEVHLLAAEGVTPYELEKVQNRYENTFRFGQYKAADRAMGLCYYTWLGDTALIDTEPDEYRRVDQQQMLQAAQEVFVDAHENRLDYCAVASTKIAPES